MKWGKGWRGMERWVLEGGKCGIGEGMEWNGALGFGGENQEMGEKMARDGALGSPKGWSMGVPKGMEHWVPKGMERWVPQRDGVLGFGEKKCEVGEEVEWDGALGSQRDGVLGSPKGWNIGFPKGWNTGFPKGMERWVLGRKTRKWGKGWRGMEHRVSQRDGALGLGRKSVELGMGWNGMECWVWGRKTMKWGKGWR